MNTSIDRDGIIQSDEDADNRASTTQPSPHIEQVSDDAEAFPAIDQALSELEGQKDRWVTLDITTKTNLLKEVCHRVESCAEAQVRDAMNAKGIPLDSPLVGEDWLSGPYATQRTVKAMIGALESLKQHGHTGVTNRDAHELPSGQVVVKVFPTNFLDRMLLLGFHGEVRLQPHVSIHDWQARAGLVYRTPPQDGKIALVLGAGNVASIGILDVIHKLYVEAQVCILKFNPVNDYLAPHYEESLRPLIDEGFVRLTKGGADEGKYLCQHPLVEEIHITGSCQTHDAIVYGGGDEGQDRKTRDLPICDKRITSELGNVSPVIIVPGSWTQREIQFHAASLATMIYNNSGFNCNAARVVIMHRDWPQRHEFTNAIIATLSSLQARPAYYPGAADRYQRFISSHEGAQAIKTQNIDQFESALPVGLLVEVDPQESNHICFNEEAFCAMAATTSLEANSVAEFIERATEFANETVWGTLNVTLIIDSRTEKSHLEELDKAIDQLCFGSVCINHWPALSYGLGSTTWGAYPGHSREDIRSGIGVVHNSFMLEDVEKTVIRGPFTMWPRPPWFMTHKNSLAMAKSLVNVTAKPSILNYMKLATHALKG